MTFRYAKSQWRWSQDNKKRPARPGGDGLARGSAHNKLTHSRKSNHSEGTGEIVAGAGGEVKVVGWSVGPHAVSKPDCPELIDKDRVAALVLYPAHQLSARGIEGEYGAVLVEIVRNQQGVAQRSKVRWCNGDSPRLVQRRTLDQRLTTDEDA